MIFGIISDTHDIDDNTIKHVVKGFLQRGTDIIVHCGDIERQRLRSELFGNLPVVCALNAEQISKKPFKNPPPGWSFTYPGDRVRDLGSAERVRCYVGHRFSFDLAAEPEASFKDRLNKLRRDHDGLRYAFAGHMHHQALAEILLVTFINPGAVQLSPDGYEYAVVDTKKDQVIFSRIPKTKYSEAPFTVGIISDSLNISKLAADFWKKLAKEFHERDVSRIIHCGNIAESDVGKEELADFEVYFKLRSDQRRKDAPENWRLISQNPPIVAVNGRKFYVHPSLARIILEKSEADMHKECLMISELHPEISFILYGNTNDAYFSEEMDGRTRIMNPGDALSSRNFATVCFPRCEVTIGKVPLDPLPPIE